MGVGGRGVEGGGRAVETAGCPQALDLSRLLPWAVQRQGWVEGGFNGRTNQLVDGCYSFWQGGVFPILQQLMQQELPQPCGRLVKSLGPKGVGLTLAAVDSCA